MGGRETASLVETALRLDSCVNRDPHDAVQFPRGIRQSEEPIITRGSGRVRHGPIDRGWNAFGDLLDLRSKSEREPCPSPSRPSSPREPAKDNEPIDELAGQEPRVGPPAISAAEKKATGQPAASRASPSLALFCLAFVGAFGVILAILNSSNESKETPSPVPPLAT